MPGPDGSRPLISIARGFFCVLVLAFPVQAAAASSGSQDVLAVDLDSEHLYEQLEPLGRAIGDSRIVLLGENGHGVGEFSEVKVKLVEWLHAEHGFEVVAFESGFFECGHVWRRLETLEPVDALLQCLRYPFQHAELIPLFDYAKAERLGKRPLEIAGMDIQAQGFDSEIRPPVVHDFLAPVDAALARDVAAADTALFLPARSGGRGDDVYAWAAENEDALRASYASAAAATDGWERWIFRLAEGWLDRLAVRGRSTAEGGPERPARYYELRDEWMARAVSALADSIDGRRKVIVWLHNDHARYGDFSMSAESHRSQGGYLHDQYGPDVFSIGLFMGAGRVADNGRNEREVAVPEPGGIEEFLARPGARASYLVLRDNPDPTVREWARAPRSYLRMGLEPLSLVPAEEFDALLYVQEVAPPDYDLR